MPGGGGPRRMPGGGPRLLEFLGLGPPRMPLPLGMPFGIPLGMPFGIGRGGPFMFRGMGEGEGPGDPGIDLCGGSPLGRLWLTTLRLWRMAYNVSIRGTRTPVSWARRIGDPRYVSTSIGLLATKSCHIMLSELWVWLISEMVFCLKSSDSLHPWAVANDNSSSMTSEMSWDTPTFSSSAA